MRDGQTSPHKPRLVVPHSTCPSLSPSPPAHSFIIGPAVINTHTLYNLLDIHHTVFVWSKFVIATVLVGSHKLEREVFARDPELIAKDSEAVASGISRAHEYPEAFTCETVKYNYIHDSITAAEHVYTTLQPVSPPQAVSMISRVTQLVLGSNILAPSTVS